jgi:hypothetical protein
MTPTTGTGTPTITLERLETPFYDEDDALELLQRAAILVHDLDPDVAQVLGGYGLDVTLTLDELQLDGQLDEDVEAIAKGQAVLCTLAATVEVLRCMMVTASLADARIKQLGNDPTLN